MRRAMPVWQGEEFQRTVLGITVEDHMTVLAPFYLVGPIPHSWIKSKLLSSTLFTSAEAILTFH